MQHANRASPWKKRGVLRSDGAKRMNFDRSSRVLRFRSKFKSFGSNKLQRSQRKEQNQNSKIPERQSNFDSRSSKIADQNVSRQDSVSGQWSVVSGQRSEPSTFAPWRLCVRPFGNETERTTLSDNSRRCFDAQKETEAAESDRCGTECWRYRKPVAFQ